MVHRNIIKALLVAANGKMTMKFKLLVLVVIAFGISGCNQAFMAGMASGLANRPAPDYSSIGTLSPSSANTVMNDLRAKREARKQEQNMKNMCEASGGRWRTGRCKY